MTQLRGAAVSAADFGLDGPRGPVFAGVGFAAEAGSLIAVTGPSGSGRTCLLLALTGRMKAGHGHAKVAGHPLPRRMAAVRRLTALGQVPGVNDLDPALTVTEQLRERVLLRRRFGGPLRSLLRTRRERAAASREQLEAALATAGLDLDTLPRGGRTAVRDLERLEELRLSVALALLGEPGLLAVDDLDLKLSEAEREAAWALLRGVADTGVTVLAVCSEPPGEGAVVVRTRTGDGEAGARAGGDQASGGKAAGGRTGGDRADGDQSSGDQEAERETDKEGAADAIAKAGRA
ncbi:ATP-binding cassette domain-containing protein [Streptomyces tubbatahanensis]|uniref:ATP-binding cassette domain-containing protein n=1 Tax=Streptomyces tubbatahanensis TaxID=2923272 RepID=A0ABY3XQ19_9ACTN|nr:ATP-binding cassette domain-containing protein [Streptomyces tubbatahanensis]UNS96562.1 ATP-binding cassette domain-containing protein [Streptomyces tubbatahanensis]